MQLIVNGEKLEFGEETSLEAIMESLGIVDKVMAAAVNSNVIKKDEWSTFFPKEDDKIELLHFVGGG